MLVTGEPGTGKTTLCRDLLEKLDRSRVRSALIFNPFLNAHEMLAALLTEFGVSAPQNASRKDLLDRLNQFLLAQLALGKSCVAIFDEAQHLSTEFLEQIRVLSNLETDMEKLLQIVLVGQPELLGRIRMPGMVQLDQRVSIRCRLTHLDARETDRYIHHRLNVAGARGQVRFTPTALKEIHRASGGVPRLINLICDRAMLAGFADQTRDLGPIHVKKAVLALRGEEPDITPSAATPTRPRSRLARMLTVAGLTLLVAGVLGVAGVAGVSRFRPKKIDPVAEAEALYWRGARPASAADGEAAFNELLTRYPTSARAAEALVGLAQFQLARGDRNAALASFQQVIRNHPDGSVRAPAVIWSALVQLDLGDSTSACRSAADVDSTMAADPFLRRGVEQLAFACGLPQMIGSQPRDSLSPGAVTTSRDTPAAEISVKGLGKTASAVRRP
jgi:general secretion pathway protein A